MELHHVFLKDNRVELVAVFAERNDDVADLICSEHGYDSHFWIGEGSVPVRYSTYDAKKKTYTDPTPEYLLSIGILRELPDNG